MPDELTIPIYTAGVRMALCGPEFLRGIIHHCDGSCCGLTAQINRRVEIEIDGMIIIIEGPES